MRVRSGIVASASEAIQSRGRTTSGLRLLDCFVASTARNDGDEARDLGYIFSCAFTWP